VNVGELQTSTEILQDLNEGFNSPHFLPTIRKNNRGYRWT